jgi:hypothetical protein
MHINLLMLKKALRDHKFPVAEKEGQVHQVLVENRQSYINDHLVGEEFESTTCDYKAIQFYAVRYRRNEAEWLEWELKL